MGVHELDGMDKPDSTGGRKPKNESKDDDTRSKGDAFMIKKDSKEWWENKINNVRDKEGKNIEDLIPRLSGHVHTHPIEVRKKLENHEIHKTDWEELKQEYKIYENDPRVIDEIDNEEVNKPKSSDDNLADFLKSSKKENTSDEKNDKKTSSGLDSLIND